MTNSINDQEDQQDTTDEVGNNDLISDQEGHPTGDIDKNPEVIKNPPDTGGGVTGGGEDVGDKIGMDDITKVGDADPEAGSPIDEDTDGSEVGQGGHGGVDEGTD